MKEKSLPSEPIEHIPLLDLKRPVTKAELVQWTGFTPRYIDQEVKKKHLRKLFSGKGARFMPADVKRWLDSKASDAKEAK